MIPTISTIPIQHLSSGDILSLQVYKFLGSQPGKKAYLQANLHGAEIVGNAVIDQLIDFLLTLDDSQLTGEIWLVPVCNPLGTNQRTHFFPLEDITSTMAKIGTESSGIMRKNVRIWKLLLNLILLWQRKISEKNIFNESSLVFNNN